MKRRLLALVLALCWLLTCGIAAAEIDPMGFEARIASVDEQFALARRQCLDEDHTPLDSPARYSILWLGYKDACYNGSRYRMEADDLGYLCAVTANFEKTVERLSGGNVDIAIDLYFIDRQVPLTLNEADGWLYLSFQTAKPDIDRYCAAQPYDAVLTTIQADDASDAEIPEQERVGVILGVETDNLYSFIGYSTFSLGKPFEGTYPLMDPAIPSLYATAVAVHEWMHQFECLGELIGVEYPDTHAYQGGYPGYSTYAADQNDYDFFEFYALVLGGMLPYTGDGAVRRVGMYPQMWPLIRRSVCDFGTFTIQDGAGRWYLSHLDGALTVSQTPCAWTLKYVGQQRIALLPLDSTHLRIDLDNAWDAEDNTVKLFTVNPNYMDAQGWRLTPNGDGSYCIRTAYASGRALTIDGPGATAVIRAAETPEASQRWLFRPAE